MKVKLLKTDICEYLTNQSEFKKKVKIFTLLEKNKKLWVTIIPKKINYNMDVECMIDDSEYHLIKFEDITKIEIDDEIDEILQNHNSIFQSKNYLCFNN